MMTLAAFLSGGGISAFITWFANRRKTKAEIDSLVNQSLFKWAESLHQEIKELKQELIEVKEELEACREENIRLREDIFKLRQLIKQN